MRDFHTTDTTTEHYKKRQLEQSRSDKARIAAKKKYKEAFSIDSVQLHKDGAFVSLSFWISNDEIQNRE